MANNAQQVYGDLRKLGLPDGAAAGVVGNLIAESGVNPLAVGDGGTSGGIAQWHNSRWDDLKRWARMQGMNWQLLSAQEGFLVHEMRQSGIWDRLKRITSPDAAASLFMLEFERPKSKDPSQRQAIAREVLAKDGNVTSSDTSKAGGGVGLDAIKGPIGAATDAVGSAISGAVNTAIAATQPIVVKSLFVALGAALIGLGVYRAASGGK